MSIVREDINFERGLKPLVSMDIGTKYQYENLKEGDILKITRNNKLKYYGGLYLKIGEIQNNKIGNEPVKDVIFIVYKNKEDLLKDNSNDQFGELFDYNYYKRTFEKVNLKDIK
jgi:hypothetical protein